MATRLRLTTTRVISDLLWRAWRGGVYLSYAMAEHDLESRGDFHREAVVVALEAFCEARGLPRPGDASKMRGGPITLDEFYGSCFDRPRRRLLIEPSGETRLWWQNRYFEHGIRPDPPGYGPMSWAGEDDPEKAVFIPHEGYGFGYAQAFVAPPWPLRLSPIETQELFLAIDDELLGRPDENTEIHRWESEWDGPDVWSPYFEGNWWGGVVWTIRISSTEIVVIGVSGSE